MIGVNRNNELLAIWAIALGVLGDVLFRNAGWGVNITIWMLAAFTAVALLHRRGDYQSLSSYIWIAAALSVLPIFRDSFFLKIITLIAILGAVSFATLASELGERMKQTVFTYLGRMADTLLTVFNVVITQLPSLVPRVSHEQLIPSPMTIRIMRGVAFASLALLIFGSLLISADAVFEKLVIDVFDLDLPTILSHIGMALLWSWIGCTLLVVLTTGPKSIFGKPLDEPRATGYAIEVNIVLGTINALFIVFVSIQVGYFFGGHEHVLDEAGPTYAEYARRGFFEISAVAVLAFGLVLLCDHLIPLAKSTGRIAFTGLTELHIGLVGVLIASAFHRLVLYMGVYGLTELRFYVAIAIVWIALAFVLLGYAVLLPTRAFLPRVLVATLFIAVFVLYAINPAAIVVQTNFSRENVQEAFDVEYALSMTGDAAPALVGGLANLTDTQREQIEKGLAERWAADDASRFRDWNYSRWNAARIVQSNSQQVITD